MRDSLFEEPPASLPLWTQPVTLFLVRADVVVAASHTMAGKRWLRDEWIANGGQVYAAWNGAHRTDIFHLRSIPERTDR